MKHKVKKSSEQGREENSIDLHHRHNQQWSLDESPQQLLRAHAHAHTQVYYHFSANVLLHNLHLSQTHNGRLVISKFSRPLQNCLLRPRRLNGPFISAERNNQCQTRLAQRGNSVGTWEKHGLVS